MSAHGPGERPTVARASGTTIEVDGRSFVYFGGCAYLGLAQHPEVAEALVRGVGRYGISAGASRETSGNTLAHEQLEAALRGALDCEALLLLPEGYTANFAAAQALGEECEAALIDANAHPSLFDAARAAQLDVTSYAHLDLDLLRSRLHEGDARRTVVMTDAVFPSRGEIVPVAELVALAAASGAWLVLDDCHATGVVGAQGRGSLESIPCGLERVLVTSTLSKALGTYGGFVAASARTIAALRARSQTYVGTTPIPPALAEAALVAVQLAFRDDDLIGRMRANAACLRAGLERLGLPTPGVDLPVFVLACASAERTRELHHVLRGEGLFVPWVQYPGQAGDGHLRLVVNAAHSIDDVERLLDALTRLHGALR